MSWFRDGTLTWAQLLCVRILKCGAIPKHIAFIMDGNRRYAKQNNVKKIEGHSKGFDKLSETLQWCLDLGILEVTVYAFSIENFNRTKEEVNDLLELARDKFKRLLEEKDKLMENEVRIRVIGNKSLLPADLVQLMAKIELLTRYNSKATLNVAFAYTARDEMTEGMWKIAEANRRGQIDDEDVNVGLLLRSLYTRDSPEPELLIRTSGEMRISDYLLLQCAYSYIHFTQVLWPDMTVWDLMSAVFHYQRVHPRLARMRATPPSPLPSDRAAAFLRSVDEEYWNAATLAVAS